MAGDPGYCTSSARWIETAHQCDVTFQRRRQVSTLPQARYAAVKFAILAGIGRPKIIAARASVGIDIAQRFALLFYQILQYQHLHQMFQHIRMVTGMKSVSIAEHRLGTDRKSRAMVMPQTLHRTRFRSC